MTDKDANFLIPFLGLLIGLGGLIYGIVKDIQLRKVKRRGNAPHFFFRCFLLNSSGASRPEGGSWEYDYPATPHKLGEQLIPKEHGENRIPKDYPDNYPVGILVKNDGAKIRYFKTKSKDKLTHIVFRKSDYGKELYEIYYMFNWANFEKKVKFNLIFESDQGIKGKQTWSLVIGKDQIKRIKPK